MAFSRQLIPVEASKQKQVILHVATDSELFGCRTSVELLVVSEVRCLEYSFYYKLQLLFDILV